jgi:hypothetical protein
VSHEFVETCLEAVGYTITSIRAKGRTFLVGFAGQEGFMGAVGRPRGANGGLVFSCGFDIDPREVGQLAKFAELVRSVIARDLGELGLR